MREVFSLLVTVGFGVFALAGCSTPSCRSKEKAAAFQKLSSEDQCRVLHGEIRQGMNRDDVYIAWGAPDWKFPHAADKGGKDDRERWIYYWQMTNYSPMASGDAVHGFFPTRVPGGLGYEDTFDYPNIEVTDTHYKRADFSADKVVDFEQRRGGRHLPPALR